MKGKIAQEFMRKEKRLIDLCTEIARILRQSGRWSDLLVAEDLESTARDLSIAQTIDEKKEIVSSIKNGFHKEGIFDWGPHNMEWKEWRAKVDELYDLIWIYQEARYSDLWKK